MVAFDHVKIVPSIYAYIGCLSGCSLSLYSMHHVLVFISHVNKPAGVRLKPTKMVTALHFTGARAWMEREKNEGSRHLQRHGALQL